MTTSPHVRPTLAERVMSRVDQSGTNGCWQWLGYCHPKTGYGSLRTPTGNVSAHRFVYELLVGPIPDGKIIDHVCHHRSCVNPEHLRPVSYKQNNENRTNAHNPHGFRGVVKVRNGYSARANHNYKLHYAGTFATPEEAGEAARLLRLQLHTHNDHDRTSNPANSVPN